MWLLLLIVVQLGITGSDNLFIDLMSLKWEKKSTGKTSHKKYCLCIGNKSL